MVLQFSTKIAVQVMKLSEVLDQNCLLQCVVIAACTRLHVTQVRFGSHGLRYRVHEGAVLPMVVSCNKFAVCTHVLAGRMCACSLQLDWDVQQTTKPASSNPHILQRNLPAAISAPGRKPDAGPSLAWCRGS